MPPYPEKDSILVLDIDGTLTDSVAMHQEALLGAMRALDLSRLDTDWASYPEHTDTGILAHAVTQSGILPFQQPAVKAFETDLDRRFATLLDMHGLAEICGAKSFVDATKQSRWGIVFATGGVRQVSHRKLRAVGIDYADETLVTSSEHASRFHLVDAAIHRASQFYGIAAPKVIVSIGDGVWDLKVANALRIAFIGVDAPGRKSSLRSSGMPLLTDFRDAMQRLAEVSGSQLA